MSLHSVYITLCMQQSFKYGVLAVTVFFKAQVSPCPNIWLKHTLPQGLVIAVPITVCRAVKLKTDKQNYGQSDSTGQKIQMGGCHDIFAFNL